MSGEDYKQEPPKLGGMREVVFNPVSDISTLELAHVVQFIVGLETDRRPAAERLGDLPDNIKRHFQVVEW